MRQAAAFPLRRPDVPWEFLVTPSLVFLSAAWLAQAGDLPAKYDPGPGINPRTGQYYVGETSPSFCAFACQWPEPAVELRGWFAPTTVPPIYRRSLLQRCCDRFKGRAGGAAAPVEHVDPAGPRQ
jgi:hypothetical protein